MGLAQQLNSLTWKRPQTCESCGAEFKCEIGLNGCWCTQVKLSDDAREILKSKYKSCLCRRCLEKTEAAVTRAADPK